MENRLETNAPEKLWNASYIFALVVSTFTAFSFYMNQSMLAGYLQSDGIGLTAQLAGVIVGLFSMTSLFCRPFCGVLSDRMNNVKLLMVSNLLMTAGLAGFAFVKTAPLFFAFRIMNGVGFAIGSTVQISLATRYIPRQRMGEGIGYMGLGNILGSAVAPGIGIAIAGALGMRAMLLISAALPALACFILLLMRDDRELSRDEKVHIRLRDILEPRAFAYSFSGGVFSFGNGIVNAYIVLFAASRGVESVALYFTVYAIGMFIIRPMSGKLMDKKGIRWTVYPGIVITACSFVLLACSQSLPMFLAAAVLRAIGQGSAQPSLQAGCINFIGRDRAGVATSTYYLCGDIGQGVGPMLGGLVVGAIAGAQGYQLMYLICAGLSLVSLASITVFFNRKHIR